MSNVAGYPTAYRAGSGYGQMGGFQIPYVPTYRPNTGATPRSPANTNLPKHFGARRAAGSFGSRTALRTAYGSFRPLGRLVPFLGLALTLYDLYELFQWSKQRLSKVYLNGWVQQDIGCGTGGNYYQGLTSGCRFDQLSILDSGIGEDALKWKTKLYAGYFNWLNKYPSAWHGGSYWKAKGPSEVPYPYPRWVPESPPLPFPPSYPPVHPGIDPNSLPIHRPMPTVRPLPHRVLPRRVPNPGRSPQERTSMGYSPPGATVGSPGRRPTIEISPLSPGRLSPTPAPRPTARPNHRRRPPGPRTKERKAQFGGVGAHIAYWALGWMTESLDALYAVWKALPKEHRDGWRHAPPHIALQQIYDHFDDLDLDQALQNLIDEAIEDFLYGTAGRYAKQLSRELGFGLQTGSAWRNKLIQEGIRKYQSDHGITRQDTTFDPFS